MYTSFEPFRLGGSMYCDRIVHCYNLLWIQRLYMDDYWSLILLSVIQGLTEVFPISSTGHLIIVSQLMNISFLNLALVTGLHAGSLLAIVLFFRKELSVLWRSALLS